MSRDRNDEKFLDTIYQILLETGIKKLTMSHLAQRLKMSKRTLYEIFESKRDMVNIIFRMRHRKFTENIREITEKAPDMMTAMLFTYRIQRDFLCMANLRLILDIEMLYPDLSLLYDEQREIGLERCLDAYRLGVEQGVFRDGVNIRALSRLMVIQMDALKRIEDHFPKDITLVEAYDTLWLSFLRTIASPKGVEIIDTLNIPNTI